MSLSQQIKNADLIAMDARRTRAALRWRETPGSQERQGRLYSILRQIDDAMRPLRSAIGTLAWGGQEAAKYETELRETSQALQYERKQLKKMLR